MTVRYDREALLASRNIESCYIMNISAMLYMYNSTDI